MTRKLPRGARRRAAADKAAHLVIHQTTMMLECRNCDETYKPTLPIAVPDWLALAKSFNKRHLYCRPKPDNQEPDTHTEGER